MYHIVLIQFYLVVETFFCDLISLKNSNSFGVSFFPSSLASVVLLDSNMKQISMNIKDTTPSLIAQLFACDNVV
jgi:hypothetical protein